MPTPAPEPRFGSTDDAIREHPALDSNTLRWLIHKRAENGLDQHIYPRLDGKKGPPILDLNGFAAWMRARQRAEREVA
jgi:hypothetical protein